MNGALVGNFASYTPGQDSAAAQTATHHNPLRGFSLRGHTEDLKFRVSAEQPFLGRIAHLGKYTVLYGARLPGLPIIIEKLLTEAISDGLVDPEQVFCVAMSDGVYRTHQRQLIADEFGFHVLAPGENNFEAVHLARGMREMARRGTARGCVVVIDTLSKFDEALPAVWRPELAATIKEFTRAGGTLIGIESTTAGEGFDGKPLGTPPDICRDADRMWVNTYESSVTGDATFVIFEYAGTCDCCVREVVYSYAMAGYMPDRFIFDSVRQVGYDEMGAVAMGRQVYEDHVAIKAVMRVLHESPKPIAKTALAGIVAGQLKMNGDEVFELLDRYCGDTEEHHFWNFKIGRLRGRMFSLTDNGRAHDYYRYGVLKSLQYTESAVQLLN